MSLIVDYLKKHLVINKQISFNILNNSCFILLFKSTFTFLGYSTNDIAISLQQTKNWIKTCLLSTCHICTEINQCLHGKNNSDQKLVKLTSDFKNSSDCLQSKNLDTFIQLKYLLSAATITFNKDSTNISKWLYTMSTEKFKTSFIVTKCLPF